MNSASYGSISRDQRQASSDTTANQEPIINAQKDRGLVVYFTAIAMVWIANPG